MEFSYHASSAIWIAKGERMNIDFFVAHMKHTPGTCMRAIWDASSILVIDVDHVMDNATYFYAKLFTTQLVLDETLTARAHVWSFT